MLDSILSLDASVFLFINSLPHPAWLTAVMAALSTITIGSTLWWALAVVMAARGRPEGAFRVILALVATWVVAVTILKPAIGRPRPTVTHTAVSYTAPLTTAAFPSGHAAGAAAGAYSLSRTWVGASPILWATAAAVAISRIYLGAHYPLDVVAGLLIGLACARFVTGGRVERPRGRES